MIANTDINKIVLPNQGFFGKKYLKYSISYEDAKNIRPLCIFLPNMSAYRRDFDKTKYVFVLLKDKKNC